MRIITLALLVVGCAHNGIQGRRAVVKQDPRIDAIDREAYAQIYLPDCSQGTKCVDLTTKFYEAKPQHVSKYCGGKDDDKCKMRLTGMLLAQIKLRYEKANHEKVSLLCTAHPEKCETSLAYETTVAEAHNWQVADERARRIAQLQVQINEENAEHEENRAAAWRNAASQLNPRKTTCQTQRNGMGGLQTICD